MFHTMVYTIIIITIKGGSTTPILCQYKTIIGQFFQSLKANLNAADFRGWKWEIFLLSLANLASRVCSVSCVLPLEGEVSHCVKQWKLHFFKGGVNVRVAFLP